MRNILLFVDDEKHYMSPAREYASSFSLAPRQTTSIKQSLKFIEDEKENIAGIIVDLMLPYGRGHDIPTAKMTDPPGVFLIQELFSKFKFDNNDVVVYTAMDDKSVDDFCTQHKVSYLRKADSEDDKSLRRFIRKLLEIE